jgi:GH24 family phage-related lysozyme (muramidase)
MRCTATTTGITKEKSKMFLVDRIQTIRERFKLHDIDDDIEVGLISFIYNIGHPPVGYRWFIAH